MNNQDSWWMALSQHYVSAENLVVFINVNKLSVINFSLAEILQTAFCLLNVFSLGNCFSSSIHCSGSYQHNCNSKCSNHSGLWGYWYTKTVNQLEKKRASSECWSKSEFIQVRSSLPAKFHQLSRNIFFKDLTFSLYRWGQKMYKVWRTS